MTILYTNLLKYEYSQHGETAVFLNEAYSLHFYPIITRPTRFSCNPTLIDNISVNKA